MLLPSLFVILALQLSPIVVEGKGTATTIPFSAEGRFTGCWSVSGSLSTQTFISLFSPPITSPPTPPDPANTLFLALPDDPTPNVVNQNPASLLIQMGAVTQLSRAQLCNGFAAQPFPGTLFTPQLGQNRYAGFYGSSVKVTGEQLLLPECVPPGVPGVVCDPTKATITLTSLDIIVTENIVTGYLTPPSPGSTALFKVSNVPCIPMVYNFPPISPAIVSIRGVVTDTYGFEVNPTALPVQANVVVSGWWTQINGEALFYYYNTVLLAGTRLPNQYLGVAEVKCVSGRSIKVVGGVSTASAALPFPTAVDFGTITIKDALTGIVIATGTSRIAAEVLPTASFVILAPLMVCPRTVTVQWTPPAGLTLPTGAVTSVTQGVFITKF